MRWLAAYADQRDCRMAPEVMEQSNGYDQQADIWCARLPAAVHVGCSCPVRQVAGHHAVGARARSCALCKVPAHEGSHDDSAEPSAHGARSLLGAGWGR